MLAVLGRGLPVHARRPVLARASVRFPEQREVQRAVQRGERHAWRILRQLRYSLESR